jgi:hypothetical protein
VPQTCKRASHDFCSLKYLQIEQTVIRWPLWAGVRTSAASTLSSDSFLHGLGVFGGGMTVVSAQQIAPNRRNARKGPRSSAGGMERPGDAPSRPEIVS